MPCSVSSISSSFESSLINERISNIKNSENIVNNKIEVETSQSGIDQVQFDEEIEY